LRVLPERIHEKQCVRHPRFSSFVCNHSIAQSPDGSMADDPMADDPISPRDWWELAAHLRRLAQRHAGV